MAKGKIFIYPQHSFVKYFSRGRYSYIGLNFFFCLFSLSLPDYTTQLPESYFHSLHFLSTDSQYPRKVWHDIGVKAYSFFLMISIISYLNWTWGVEDSRGRKDRGTFHHQIIHPQVIWAHLQLSGSMFDHVFKNGMSIWHAWGTGRCMSLINNNQ